MVIAGELGKPGVEEVEDQVLGEQISILACEAGRDVRPDPGDEVHVLLLSFLGNVHGHLEVVASV